MALVDLPNRVVLAVLKSPAHRLMSGALLALTVRGQKSGRDHTFPVMYARQGDSLIVVAARASTKRWWKNVRGGADVKLFVAGEPRAGRASLLADGAERGRLLRLYLDRFPKTAGVIGLGRDYANLTDSAISSRLADAEVVQITLG